MLGLDFSETRRQFSLLTTVLLRHASADDRNAAAAVFEPLVAKLDTKQTILWSVFAAFSVSCTGMILWFIDSFSIEQEKYQTVLTSVGRNHAEYNALVSESATVTDKIRP